MPFVGSILLMTIFPVSALVRCPGTYRVRPRAHRGISMSLPIQSATPRPGSISMRSRAGPTRSKSHGMMFHSVFDAKYSTPFYYSIPPTPHLIFMPHNSFPMSSLSRPLICPSLFGKSSTSGFSPSISLKPSPDTEKWIRSRRLSLSKRICQAVHHLSPGV